MEVTEFQAQKIKNSYKKHCIICASNYISVYLNI